jgi:predicted small integral membrane protein
VSLITNDNQNTNYHGLNDLLLFKSVLPFVSRRRHTEAPWIVASAYTFVLCLLHITLPKVFLLGGCSAKKARNNNIYNNRVYRDKCHNNIRAFIT